MARIELRRAAVAAIALAPLLFAAAPAWATPPRMELAVERPYARDTERHRVVMAINLGTLDRGTTGTMADFGYDATMSTFVGADLRLLAPMGGCDCLTHGLATGYTYSAGPTLGLAHDAAFRLHVVDLAYAARVEFPCMRRAHRRVHLTGLLGAAGMYADAGLGDVTRDNHDRENERTTASTAYDHFGIGWRLGVSLDFTFDTLLVGLGVDVREIYGIAAPEARTFLASLALRIGFDVGWPRAGGAADMTRAASRGGHERRLARAD